MSTFEHSVEELKSLKNKFNYSEVPMEGFHDGLLGLKKDIENVYDKMFGIGYGLSDAPYFGWSGDNLKEMKDIDKEINKRLMEIYAIILKATNSEIE